MIGIVVLTYNNWDDTKNCIDSIYSAGIGHDFYVYLVDNCSNNKPDITYTDVWDKKSNLRILRSEKNRGYSGGNNIGIQAAIKDGCDYILLSNNDVIFSDRSVDLMADFLKDNLDYGIVGSKTYKLDGSIQKYNMCVKTRLQEKYLVRTPLCKFFKQKSATYWGLDRDYNNSFDVYAVNGCCFMVHSRCYDSVFPLDDNVFLFEEEFITGIRMEQGGFKTRYLSEASVIHKHGQSTKDVSGFSIACQYVSEIYYCKVYLRSCVIKILPLYIIRLIYYLYLYLRFKSFRGHFLWFIKKSFKLLFTKRRNLHPHTSWDVCMH